MSITAATMLARDNQRRRTAPPVSGGRALSHAAGKGAFASPTRLMRFALPSGLFPYIANFISVLGTLQYIFLNKKNTSCSTTLQSYIPISTGPQERAPGPQERATGPQARAPGPQARAPGPQAHEPPRCEHERSLLGACWEILHRQPACVRHDNRVDNPVLVCRFSGVVVVDEARAPIVFLELLYLRQVDRLPETQQEENDDMPPLDKTCQHLMTRHHLRRHRLLPIWQRLPTSLAVGETVI